MASSNITIKMDTSQIQPVIDALLTAVKIIDSYESDIRNAEKVIGVDLVGLGFCQGVIYKDAIKEIKAIVDGV